MYSEEQLIRMIKEKFSQSSARVGIGDDAALIELPSEFSTLTCSDLLVENVHFLRDIHPPHSLGFKAIAVNVSDIAAMGGKSNYCQLSLAVPRDLQTAWIDAFLDGMVIACREFDICLVGGDSSDARQIFINVSIIGHVQKGKELLRSGAQSGNKIYVTGSLGGSSLGYEFLEKGEKNHPAVHRHLYPEPRHRIGPKVVNAATAMIDISDGFSTDLGHILEASGFSAEIVGKAIPLFKGVDISRALDSGEEYELIITAESLPREISGVPITCVGTVVPSNEKPEI